MILQYSLSASDCNCSSSTGKGGSSLRGGVFPSVGTPGMEAVLRGL